MYLALVAECRRSGGRSQRQWAALALPRASAEAGCAWTGRLDLDWARAELGRVKAEPGEYTAETYERWRLLGLPAWAALAAGMTPTPGSLKIVGRRPDLP